MSVNCGHITKYISEAGTGFIKTVIGNVDVPFKISSVDDPKLRKKIKTIGRGTYIFVWFRQIGKRLIIWQEATGAPQQELCEYLEALLKELNESQCIENRISDLFAQLFKDMRISDNAFRGILSSKYFMERSLSLYALLRPSQLDEFYSLCDLPAKWQDINNPLPEWVEKLSERIYGHEITLQYIKSRETALLERATRQKAEAAIAAEQQRIAAEQQRYAAERERLFVAEQQRIAAEQQRIAEQNERNAALQRRIAEDNARLARERKETHLQLASKYRIDPRGIRNDPAAKNLCLSCGSSENVDVKSPEKFYYLVCLACGCEWYHHHCWNCKSKVDSRDPATPQCHVCGWYKCSSCGACNQNGCSTNPYVKRRW